MTLTTVVQTIDDLDVSPGSGYSTVFIYSFHQPGASATFVERAEGPEVTSVAPGLYRLSPLDIVIEDIDDADTLQVSLFRALDTTEEAKSLVISDADGGNRRYVMFVTESLQQKPDSGGLEYIATLIVHEDVRWRAEEPVTEALNWTASGTSNIVTVDGHLPVYPTWTITPRQAKSVPGWPHMLYSVVQWRSPLQDDRAHPIDLTGGGWDTAALVTAGDLTNETNIGVLDESGRFIPFWYGNTPTLHTGFNQAATKIWVNHRPESRGALVLRDYLAAGDNYSTLRVNTPETGMPSTSGWLVFSDGEMISFNGYMDGALLNVVRGAGGTTPGDHPAGAPLEWVSAYRIVYGPNSAVPDRLKDEGYIRAAGQEPVINKRYSSNSEWRYDGMFRSSSGAGSAGWNYLGDRAAAFTEATGEDGVAGSFVEPWAALGLRYDVGRGAWFYRRFTIPLASVRATGNRFAFGYEIDYPGAPQLCVLSGSASNRVTLWNSDSAGLGDAPFDTGTLNTPTVADIANTELDEDEWRLFDRLRFEITDTSHIQTDIQVMYVTFVGDYAPVVTLITATNSYDMSMALHNVTAGEALYIDAQDVALNESIVINTADSTVTYSADNSNRYANVTQDAPRAFFLRLLPGDNDIVLYESGLSDVDVDIAYTPRYYK